MEHRAIVRFLTLKGLKAQEIEMELTSVYSDEAIHISDVKKWRTHFLQRRTELGDNSRSGRPVNSDLTSVIAELIQKCPFHHVKYSGEISRSRRDISQISSRETRAQNVSSSMGSTSTHLEQNMKASRVAMLYQFLEIQGGEKISDPRPIFLRTENCQSPNNIFETKLISESIICVERENLSIGSGAEDLF
jgi:hypothetical protein